MADRWRLAWKKKDGSGGEQRTLYFYTDEKSAQEDARRMNYMFPDTAYWTEQEPKSLGRLERMRR